MFILPADGFYKPDRWFQKIISFPGLTATGRINSQIVIIIELFYDTAHRQPVPATAVVRAGVAAVEAQGPREVAGVICTGPVVAVAATGAQRTVAGEPVPGCREHQVITKKPGSAVVGIA